MAEYPSHDTAIGQIVTAHGAFQLLPVDDFLTFLTRVKEAEYVTFISSFVMDAYWPSGEKISGHKKCSITIIYKSAIGVPYFPQNMAHVFSPPENLCVALNKVGKHAERWVFLIEESPLVSLVDGEVIFHATNAEDLEIITACKKEVA